MSPRTWRHSVRTHLRKSTILASYSQRKGNATGATDSQTQNLVSSRACGFESHLRQIQQRQGVTTTDWGRENRGEIGVWGKSGEKRKRDVVLELVRRSASIFPGGGRGPATCPPAPGSPGPAPGWPARDRRRGRSTCIQASSRLAGRAGRRLLPPLTKIWPGRPRQKAPGQVDGRSACGREGEGQQERRACDRYRTCPIQHPRRRSPRVGRMPPRLSRTRRPRRRGAC